MPRTARQYVPMDVNYADDPRVISAGEPAEVLFIRALCVAKRTMSDGFVDKVQLVRFGLADIDDRVARLVDVGLWDPVILDDGGDGTTGEIAGYQVRSWLKWNASAEQIEEKSVARAKAGKKGGQRRGENLRARAAGEAA